MKCKLDSKSVLAELALGLVLLMTPGAVRAQDAASQPTQSQNTNRDDRGFNPGWLGLIGLAGLAGLRRRERTPTARLASDVR
jgi:MYXO-CTERM domain-containing protein